MAAEAKALEREVILMKTHPPDEFRRGTASGETVGEWAWDGRQEIRGTGGRTREGVWVGISKSGLSHAHTKAAGGQSPSGRYSWDLCRFMLLPDGFDRCDYQLSTGTLGFALGLGLDGHPVK